MVVIKYDRYVIAVIESNERSFKKMDGYDYLVVEEWTKIEAGAPRAKPDCSWLGARLSLALDLRTLSSLLLPP